MRKSQTLQLEMSEKRSELAAVTETLNAAATAGTDPSAEDLVKAEGLTKEIRSKEVLYRAAILEEEDEDRKAAAEGGGDPEMRELMALESGAKFSAYVGAALEMRGVSGGEAELNAAIKIGANQVPMMLFAPSEAELRETEKRTKTDTDIAIRPRRWVDRLFAGTAADYLGVTMESVEAGAASFPVTTGGGVPAQRGREEAAAAGAWTIGVASIEPTRQSLHYQFAVEDNARVPGLEDALTRDMRAALRERLDYTVFLGDTGANEAGADITGFFGSGAAETTITQASKVTGAGTLAKFLALVDGLHAESLGDLRIVASVGANTLWGATVLPAPATTGETVAQFLTRAGLSWRARHGIDTATASGDFMAAIGLSRGIEGAAVMAMWPGAELIRDPYSGAASGQVRLTLHSLWNWALVRSSNFKRLKAVA